MIFRAFSFSANQEKNFSKLLLQAAGETTTKDWGCLKAEKAVNPFVINWINVKRTLWTSLVWPPFYIGKHENLCKHLTWYKLFSPSCYPALAHSYILAVFVLCRHISHRLPFLFRSNRGYHRRTISDTSTAVSSNAEATTCSASTETAISAFLATDTSESTGNAPEKSHASIFLLLTVVLISHKLDIILLKQKCYKFCYN